MAEKFNSNQNLLALTKTILLITKTILNFKVCRVRYIFPKTNAIIIKGEGKQKWSVKDKLKDIL